VDHGDYAKVMYDVRGGMLPSSTFAFTTSAWMLGQGDEAHQVDEACHEEEEGGVG
jgi:hypothetical protein